MMFYAIGTNVYNIKKNVLHNHQEKCLTSKTILYNSHQICIKSKYDLIHIGQVGCMTSTISEKHALQLKVREEM